MWSHSPCFKLYLRISFLQTAFFLKISHGWQQCIDYSWKGCFVDSIISIRFTMSNLAMCVYNSIDWCYSWLGKAEPTIEYNTVLSVEICVGTQSLSSCYWSSWSWTELCTRTIPLLWLHLKKYISSLHAFSMCGAASLFPRQLISFHHGREHERVIHKFIT